MLILTSLCAYIVIDCILNMRNHACVFHPLQITASAGQTLLNLDLSNCLSLTDQCCTSIARNCKVLEVLGLTNLKEIKGDNLCKFFQNEERAKQFRAIMLSGSKNVRQRSCILYSQGFIQRWGSPGKIPPPKILATILCNDITPNLKSCMKP